MSQRYLFDSDSLIVAKNYYYSPDFSIAFWDWIIAGNQNGVLYTIDKVIAELRKGNEDDFLHQFAVDHESTLGLTTSDEECLERYGQVQIWASTAWANNKNPNKIAKALETFAKETIADPWLVAYASINNFCIVTNEEPAPSAQTSVKLPDAANAFGVKVVKLHEVLSIHSGQNFTFKTPI